MVDVTFLVNSIRGSSKVPLFADKSILFNVDLELDGRTVYTEGEVRLTLDSSEGFLLLELHRPSAERMQWIAKHTKTSKMRWYGYENIRAMYSDPAQYMDGTDDDVLILGVQSIQFVERKLPPPERLLALGVYPIPT